MENWNVMLETRLTILLIGNDAALSYLLRRFAQRSGYQWKVYKEKAASREIADLHPIAVIFQSMELLARNQAFVAELANLDVPILVCSSVLEEARARELGADYCLLHPLTYDNFQTALANTTTSKHP